MVILMLYVIPDTHLGHRAMCYSCGRPLDFSEQICRNWQEIVEPEDTVIHLGDVAWDARWLHRMMRLPGSKILVHPSVREIMALGQNALGEIRLRDLCGTMPYDVGFTALTFTGADGSLQIPYKHVVYWKAKQGVFFLVLQDFRMPIGKRETGKASMTIHRTKNRETVYTCDMSRAVRERQGRYTLFWLPIRQTD